MRLAVFDCDGTLVDSSHNIVAAMTRAFAGHGLAPPPAARVRRVVGLSLAEAVEALLPGAEPSLHAALAHAYRDAFRQLRSTARLAPEPMFEGVRELLDTLRDSGWLLAVATGKSDRGLAFVLEAHGLSGHFTCLHTADRHPSKPDPSMLLACLDDAGAAPHEAVVIGDTVFDIGMGASAGVRAIGVDWGYHEGAELLRAGAAAIARDAGHLERLLHG
jgi:phosphoglycolate phosphatase